MIISEKGNNLNKSAREDIWKELRIVPKKLLLLYIASPSGAEFDLTVEIIHKVIFSLIFFVS